jgi:thioredoxin
MPRRSAPAPSRPRAARPLALLLILLLTAAACGCDASEAPQNAGPSMVKPIHNQAELDAVMAGGGKRLLLLDLYADWCGPCHQLMPVLEALARENRESVSIYKIDVERNEDIARRFGVRGIPHVAFVRSGKTLLNLQGLQPKTNYQKAIRKFTAQSD